MANTLASAIAAMSPLNYWPMTEQASPYADTGSSGDNLTEQVAGTVDFGMVGVLRGTPRNGGVWVSNDSGTPASGAVASATGPTSASWATGAVGAFFMLTMNNADSLELGLVSLKYLNSNYSFDLSVTSDRRVKAEFQGNVAYSISSAAGVVQFGVPYCLTAVQRGDGNNVRLLLNEADVTDVSTKTGAGGVNNWFQDSMLVGSSQVCSGIRIGSLWQSPTTLPRAIISAPFVIGNGPPASNTDFFNLYGAGGLNDDASDYQEYIVQNLMQGEFSCLFTGLETAGDSVRTQGNQSVITDPVNYQLNPGWADDDDVVTDYTKRKLDVTTAGCVRASGGCNLLSSTGTLSLLFKVTDVSVGTKELFNYGVNNGGAAYAAMNVRMEGSGFTTGTLYFKFWDGPGGSVESEWRPGLLTIPVAGDKIMFTITQDGVGGFQFYINGDLTSGDWVTDTAARTNWFDTVEASSSSDNYLVIGRNWSSGSANNDWDNEVNHVIISDDVLDAAGVAELWNAVNGIFPDINNQAPAGGFYNTLITIGNAGDPNGPGPDHYWRMNSAAALISDIGISTVDGNSITEGGDPAYRVNGPLVSDPSNFAVFFDGTGDYFEIGEDGISGDLITATFGTAMFFAALRQPNEGEVNIAYSQSNAAASSYIEWGVDENDFPYMKIQNSASDWIKFTSSIQITDLAFYWIVVTNDGTNWIMYLNATVDASAAITTSTVTTLAEGDWFADITTTHSAVAARAATAFPQEANGRFSEIAFWDEALSAAEIGALWAAALLDGVAGTASEAATMVFENVTFLNGGDSDLKITNALTDFVQAVMLDRTHFVGGAQGATKQSVKLVGEIRAQVHASSFDLDAAPVDGRVGILATTAVPTTGATAYGSLIVTDSTFDRMGSVARAAVFLESGYGASVQKNRFLDNHGAAVGWAADARRVMVLKNLIDTLTGTVAAIRSEDGQNSNIGSNWLVAGNSIRDANIGIALLGASSLAGKAANVQIIRNLIENMTAEGIKITDIEDALIARNMINDGSQGIDIGNFGGSVVVHRNLIADHSDEGIIMSAATEQTGTLVIDANTIDGGTVGDGILVTNVSRLGISNNHLLRTPNAIQLGNLGVKGHIFGNEVITSANPFFLIGGTTQVGLEIGQNNWPSAGGEEDLTVATNAIAAFAPFHTITAGGVTDLETITGPDQDGFLLVLLLATGSSAITVTTAGNIQLDGAASYIMGTAAESQIWLQYDKAGDVWNEISRGS